MSTVRAVAQPHDRLVKHVFSKKTHARGLLRAVLKPELVAGIAWSTLRLLPHSFVEPALQSRHLDLLFSVKIRGEVTYVYVLLEHQSTVEPLMVLRVLGYMVRTWERLVQDEPGRTEIPAILPVLLHHGATGWTAARSFHDVVTLPKGTQHVLGRVTPAYEMEVVELHEGQAARMAVEMLTPFARVALWCLSVAGDDARLRQEIGRLREAIDAMLVARDGVDALRAILRYLLATHRRLGARRIANLLETTASKARKRAIMDELDEFRKEGRVEGRATALLEQLQARFGRVPAPVKARVLAAPEATLARWSLRVLTASTLNGVLRGAARKTTPARHPRKTTPARRTRKASPARRASA